MSGSKDTRHVVVIVVHVGHKDCLVRTAVDRPARGCRAVARVARAVVYRHC